MAMKTKTVLQEISEQRLQLDTRRHFLKNCTTGLGAIWLASRTRPLVAGDEDRTQHPGVGKFPARVKRVIFLHMVGAPSQLELFDYKPELNRFDGKDCPAEFLKGNRFPFIQGKPKLLGAQYPFQQHGKSGLWVSDRFPNIAKNADDICLIKTMQTDQFNHGPAQLMVHAGQPRIGYPSMGSWVTWGLGTENENLPGFMVLFSGGRNLRVGNALWSSGYLPSVYQGVQCRRVGEPILNISNPKDVSAQTRRNMLDTLARLNQMTHQEFGDPETLTRISQYEMAFRMQTAVPEIADISRETRATLDAYGAKPGKPSFANNCLLARRLVEAGVRFVQLFDWGWDSHGSADNEALNTGFKHLCVKVDKPIHALLEDLKARGLLEDTLVVWGGEFGRTPMKENRGGRTMMFIGRDHNPHAFCWWMAGGGVKTGFSFGETDEFGYRAVENPVQLRDFHATLLRLLGIDHQRFSYFFQGLEQKLTGVKPARVMDELLS